MYSITCLSFNFLLLYPVLQRTFIHIYLCPLVPAFPLGSFLGRKAPGHGVCTSADSPNCFQNSCPDPQAHRRMHTLFCTLTGTFPILNISMSSFLILEFKRKKQILDSSGPTLHGLLISQPLMEGWRAPPPGRPGVPPLTGQAFSTCTRTRACMHTHATHRHTHTASISG